MAGKRSSISLSSSLSLSLSLSLVLPLFLSLPLLLSSMRDSVPQGKNERPEWRSAAAC